MIMKEIECINILKVNNKIKEKVRLWRNKDEIRKLMINQHIITKEEHSKWLENLKSKNDCMFWVVFYNNIPIGSVQLQNMDHDKLTSEWGFYIGENNYRGPGIGAIIEFNLLEYFFNILKFKKLNGTVLENNTLVIRMNKKFGFKIIGREKKIIEKKEHSIILLSIKKNDWMNLRKGLRNISFAKGI